jgi:uncharacterized protein
VSAPGTGGRNTGTGGRHTDRGTERDPGQEVDRGLGRDRDAAGRPRNARPRDGLGRPLPRDAAGEPVTPDDLDLSPRDAVLLAQRLIDDGRPFHAHEVLEATWKAAPKTERDLWQGLAQIAVGLTHARRGNARGAVTLLRRGAAAVAGYGDAVPSGVPAELNAPGAAQAARALADRIADGGLGSVAPALHLRMTR